MPESPAPIRRSPTLQFFAGLFSGVGIILATLVALLLSLGLFEKWILSRGLSEAHFLAVVWAVLALGWGLFVFRKASAQRRPSTFHAGLLVAAALFLLLDSACWGFSFR